MVEVQTVQVPKKDDAGNPVKDAKGNPVMVDQKVDTQSIVEGPIASQMAIKMLGTNGGGYTNANAAHPFENPTPLSNFIQMLSIFAIPSALTYYLGRMVKNQRHGWTVWTAMAIVFVAGALVCWGAEAAGNPIVHQLGVDRAGGNMEGKEVRFGIFNSALFATITTDASCGAVNAMHDSFTPLGGFVPLFNIQLGEIIFGGVGSGLYGMILFIVLAVFIAGLMVGRTPEYLGKKIESYDVKVASIAILLMAFSILGFSGWAALTPWGQAGTNNSGPHGLSEIFYAYSSCTGNNGSAFAGLTANPANGDPHYRCNPGFRDDHWPVWNDRPGDGVGRLTGTEKNGRYRCRHIPRDRRVIRDSSHRNDSARWRINFSTRANTDSDSGAFPDAKRKTVLSDET